jgi:hypothetical protein
LKLIAFIVVLFGSGALGAQQYSPQQLAQDYPRYVSIGWDFSASFAAGVTYSLYPDQSVRLRYAPQPSMEFEVFEGNWEIKRNRLFINMHTHVYREGFGEYIEGGPDSWGIGEWTHYRTIREPGSPGPSFLDQSSYDRRLLDFLAPGWTGQRSDQNYTKEDLIQAFGLEGKQGSVYADYSKPSLVIQGLTASSTLTEPYDANAYHPSKAFDGDPETMWFEAAEGPGIGESLRFVLAEPLDSGYLYVSPGCFLEPYYEQNNRLKDVLIIINDEIEIEHRFWDQMMEQKVNLTPGEYSYLSVRSVEIIIKSVYPSTKWDDTAISEIKLADGGYSSDLLEILVQPEPVRPPSDPPANG